MQNDRELVPSAVTSLNIRSPPLNYARRYHRALAVIAAGIRLSVAQLNYHSPFEKESFRVDPGRNKPRANARETGLKPPYNEIIYRNIRCTTG